MDSNASNIRFASKITNIDGKIVKDGKLRTAMCNVSMSELGTFVTSLVGTVRRKNDASIEPDLEVNNDTKNNNNTIDRVNGIDEVGSGKKQTFAEMFKKSDAPRAARLNMMTSEQVPGANVAIPLADVEEINAWEKFSLERVMLTNGFFFFQIATREGMERALENGPWLIRMIPIILNIWTPNTKLKKDTITSALGRNTYALALIEVSALTTLMESVVISVPYPDGFRHSHETVDVEYGWQPPWYDCCKVFDHVNTDCPKQAKVVEIQVENDDDGFTKVTRKNGKGKQDGKVKQIAGHDELKDHNVKPISRPNISMDEGIDLISLRNSFETLMERDKVLDVADPQSIPTNTDPLDDDEEEVKEVFTEPDPNISKQLMPNDSKGESTPNDAGNNV
nr:hypothetical protein [Tanacetum cinerariifolium]